MRRLVSFLSALSLIGAFGACGDVPIDNERNDRRLIPPLGVIRGTVSYVGPRPCSMNGHIVGNAIMLVFNRRNPPPPLGLATGAVNFVAVPGDVLFANEPRSVGKELACPPDDVKIEATAPFAVAPLDAGSYVISAFYDRRGRFSPTFKFRNLPEAGDLGGGYIDVEDARRNEGDISYQPIYLPVNVGIPRSAEPGTIPEFSIDQNGFVADNVPVTIGRVVPFTRPYFYPQALDPSTLSVKDSAEAIGEPQISPANPSGDPLAVPILAMRQDLRVLALPASPTPETLTAYQKSFPNLRLAWSVPNDEFDDAVEPSFPFGFQIPPLPPRGKGGLLVYARGGSIPENAAVPALWPQMALVKLADDPFRRTDKQSLVVQGTPEESNVTGKPPGPLVVLQGITLFDDSLAKTIAGPVPKAATTDALRAHVTTMLRPAVVCFDPKRVDQGGLLVTPHLTGKSADANETGDKPLIDLKKEQPLVRDARRGCLPLGRYAISLVYPTGQSWTVPNEAGSCAEPEGNVVLGGAVGSCATRPRPVLLSQGARAVVEIIEAQNPATCDDHPVPAECLPP